MLLTSIPKIVSSGMDAAGNGLVSSGKMKPLPLGDAVLSGVGCDVSGVCVAVPVSGVTTTVAPFAAVAATPGVMVAGAPGVCVGCPGAVVGPGPMTAVTTTVVVLSRSVQPTSTTQSMMLMDNVRHFFWKRISGFMISPPTAMDDAPRYIHLYYA